MAPTEYTNVYTNFSSQHNTTNFSYPLYNITSKTHTLSSPFNDQELLGKLYHTNKTSYEKFNVGESLYKENSTTSLMYQYFALLSYFIGNLWMCY